MPWSDKDREGEGGSIEYMLSITESRAGYTEYNEGNTCLLILEGEQEFDNGTIRDTHLWVNTPKGWTCSDDGSAFVDEDGDDDRRFEKNSKLQRFINSAIKAGVPLEDRGKSALDATMWKGLKLRIREEEKTFTRREDKTEASYRQPLVIEFLGEIAVAASSPKAKAEVSASANAASNDNGQVARATEIAREVKSKDGTVIEYMDRVSKELSIPLSHELCSSSFFESV